MNEAYDFFGNRVVPDRDILDMCFLMIIRIIEPLAREYIESRKRAWAQHPEIKTLRELEREHFVYVDTPKPNLETESPSSSAGLGIITPDPIVRMLGPGYMHFASPFGIKGVARESANRVDLLAVASVAEGTSHFRAFTHHCQATMTPFVFGRFGTMLRAALRRYRRCNIDCRRESLDPNVTKPPHRFAKPLRNRQGVMRPTAPCKEHEDFKDLLVVG